MQKFKKYIYIIILLIALILSNINIKCKADYIVSDYLLPANNNLIQYASIPANNESAGLLFVNDQTTGSITISGSASSTCWNDYNIISSEILKPGKYYLNGSISESGLYTYIAFYNSGSYVTETSFSSDDGLIFDCTNITYTEISIKIYVYNNTTLNNIKTYINLIKVNSIDNNLTATEFKTKYFNGINRYPRMTANDYYLLKDVIKYNNSNYPHNEIESNNDVLGIGYTFYNTDENRFYYLNSYTENNSLISYNWIEYYDVNIYYATLTTYSQAFATGGAEGYSTGYLEGLRNTEEGYILGYTEGQTAGQNMGYNTGYGAGYDDGYDTGYEDGEITGYDTGYDAGDVAGYNRGYNDLDAYADDMTLFLKALFQGFEDFFAIHIGNVTIGAIILIPLSISLAWFIIKQFRGGGN